MLNWNTRTLTWLACTLTRRARTLTRRARGRPEDKANLVSLVSEMRAAFAATGRHYMITAAVGIGKETADNAYDIPPLARDMDFINLMTYDMHGAWEDTMNHHAPLFAGESTVPFDYPISLEWAVNYWIDGECGKKIKS
eukprot:2393814-Pyramimonas_sp.AAC.2